jgi:hypothetical protein
MQAVTRVNAEQASKRVMWEPTRLNNGEGRRRSGGRATAPDRSHRGSGDGMHERGNSKQHGKPLRRGRVTLNRNSARSRPGRVGWRRGP